MRKIVNGLLYDTDTATDIAKAKFSTPSNFKHWEETLYRTDKGNYFLEGAGGPMSKYGKPTGNNSTTGSRDIIPLKKSEAAKWLEKEGTVEEFLDEFPDRVKKA